MRLRPLHPDLLEEQSALLPASPAAAVARWTAWLLLAVFGAATALVCLVRLPEVVLAPFVLEPESGADPIQAPLTAELAAIRIREGQSVKAGDELLTLRSDEIRNWQARLKQVREDERALEERTNKLEEAQVEALSIKDAEINQAEREVVFRQEFAKASQDFAGRMKKLFDSGYLSEIELIRDQLQAAQAEKDLAVAEKTRQQLTLQRQGLETARARERIEETAAAKKFTTQISVLERQVDSCTGDVKSVRAPYDAIVISLKQRNIGSIVGLGAELCQLSPTDARPVARLSLPESGLPRLKAGQMVRLRCEAYPYQRYGSVPATLVWISPAAIAGPSGSTFQAMCQLQFPAPGSQVNPKLGMRGQARILVGRRTVLERLLEPLHGLRERVNAA